MHDPPPTCVGRSVCVVSILSVMGALCCAKRVKRVNEEANGNEVGALCASGFFTSRTPMCEKRNTSRATRPCAWLRRESVLLTASTSRQRRTLQASVFGPPNRVAGDCSDWSAVPNDDEASTASAAVQLKFASPLGRP